MSRPVVKVAYFGGPWDGLACAMKPEHLHLGDVDRSAEHPDGHYLMRLHAGADPLLGAGMRWEWCANPSACQ